MTNTKEIVDASQKADGSFVVTELCDWIPICRVVNLKALHNELGLNEYFLSR